MKLRAQICRRCESRKAYCGLAGAVAEKRILVTNDKDFGELTFRQNRLSSGIILFRLKGQSTQEKVRLVNVLTKDYGDRLPGHFTVVTRKRIRTIPLEEKK